MDKSLYLIGSLRQADKVQSVAAAFRKDGWDVFDDWLAAGPEADDYWQKYANQRGQNVKEALAGYPAQQVFKYDKTHLDRCSMAMLVLPAGKSGHLELGYVLGKGKPGFILLDGEPERYDVMYNFADGVFVSLEEAQRTLNAKWRSSNPQNYTVESVRIDSLPTLEELYGQLRRLHREHADSYTYSKGNTQDGY